MMIRHAAVAATSRSRRGRFLYTPGRPPRTIARMSDVTRILQAIETGDKRAAEELLPLVYEQLRGLARSQMSGERRNHTLQPTALVHEAYLRLVGPDDGRLAWANRAHFFAAAVEAMRRILVEHARGRARLKRGGGRVQLSLGQMQLGSDEQLADVLALDEALTRLGQHDPQLAQIVSLRFFAGLGVPEVAEVLSLSPRTVKREWSLARAWLYKALAEETPDEAGGDTTNDG